MNLNKDIYVGIDLGTSSIKILAINIRGDILASVTKGYKTSILKKSYSEQNPEDWYEQMINGLKDLSEIINLNRINAISFSGQMHGLVLIDNNGDVIRPAILWNDQRTVEECEYLNNIIGKEKLLNYTGNIAITGFTAPKVLWIKNNERENFEKINKILLPKDYLAFKLTGEYYTDYSDASGTLYFNVKEKKWSEEMINILEIKEEQLPAAVSSFKCIGRIKEDIKKDLNIVEDIKVVIGGGDQAVAAIGGGVVGKNCASISLGTSGVVFGNIDNFDFDSKGRLHSFCNANDGYHMMGVTLNAANSLKWWVESINEEVDYSNVMDDVDNNLKNDIIFLPYMTGERTPHNDPFAKGIFWGLNISTSKNDMTKAILEGVAFSLRDCFELMGDKFSFDKLIINGGGSKSKEWCQIIADVFNKPVILMNSNEGPALGACILAMVGDGIYSSVENATNHILLESNKIMPNKENEEYYNKKYLLYKEVYLKNKDLFK